MGQNLALNVAEKGFPISVYNRSGEKTDGCVKRAEKEGLSNNLRGYKDFKEFVESIEKPRHIIILVKAGAPVDATIEGLSQFLEPGDCIIDGGNEWYENTERRMKQVQEKGLLYLGMGVSGGEEGARNGPLMMPGGSEEAYKRIEDILKPVSAQTNTGACVTYVGKGGAGNFVKMVHNGIEYGDMQLISEAYDILKTVGGLTNEEMHAAFVEWNKAELESYLIEISSYILEKKDDKKDDNSFLVDKILDKTGMKGTGKWTVQQAAELSIAAPTIASSLDSRFLSGLKDERVAAEAVFKNKGLVPANSKGPAAGIDKKQLIVDDQFASELVDKEQAWRRVIVAAVNTGVSTPSMSSSLNYFDTYRRGRCPANLVQAQRDFFGSHTYERMDMEGWHHTLWSDMNSVDSITTSGYTN